VDRSWAALTSPQRIGGRTPTQYSRAREEDTRNAKAAAYAYQQQLRSTSGSRAALTSSSGRPLTSERPRTQESRGGRYGMPGRSPVTGRPKQAAPKLVAPLRSFPGGPQRDGYERPGPYTHVPNPAIDPPLDYAELRHSFPWSARPEVHQREINPQVEAGDYATHWDDAFAGGKYQPYQVEVVSTGRPSPSPGSEEAGSPQSFGRTDVSFDSETPPALAATALGFGRRHTDYRRYLYGDIHTNRLQQQALTQTIPRQQVRSRSPESPNDSPTAPFVAPDRRVLLPVAPHLLSQLPPEELHSAGPRDVALAVPYHLARFVPLDPRDGDGHRGHVNASSLGYGKGHRNHYKYLHPNVEGKEDLALFRSTHVA
jgi:hypothetical protein